MACSGAVSLLAEGEHDCLDHVLQLLGFNDDVVTALIRAGLASVEVLRRVGGRVVLIRRYRITNAGRRELAR